MCIGVLVLVFWKTTRLGCLVVVWRVCRLAVTSGIWRRVYAWTYMIIYKSLSLSIYRTRLWTADTSVLKDVLKDVCRIGRRLPPAWDQQHQGGGVGTMQCVFRESSPSYSNFPVEIDKVTVLYKVLQLGFWFKIRSDLQLSGNWDLFQDSTSCALLPLSPPRQICSKQHSAKQHSSSILPLPLFLRS